MRALHMQKYSHTFALPSRVGELIVRTAQQTSMRAHASQRILYTIILCTVKQNTLLDKKTVNPSVLGSPDQNELKLLKT